MIAEQVTATTTFTSIKDLIETARSDTLGNSKCVGIKFSYTGTAVISMKDSDTITAVTILDGSNSILSASVKAVDFDKVLIKTATGTDAVNVIVEQERI